MERSFDDVDFDGIMERQILTEKEFKLVLETFPTWPELEARDLLRTLLMRSGTLGIDEFRLEDIEHAKKNGRRFDATDTQNEEYIRRLHNYGQDKKIIEIEIKAGQLEEYIPIEPPWEGITWTLDTLRFSPNQALRVIESYMATHFRLPDGRLRALEDVASLIRARYIGFPESTSERIDLILERPPRDLEILAALLYEAMNYRVSITKKTRDGGRDLVALRDQAGQREHLLVECKRWSGTVDVDVPRNLLGVLTDEKAGKGVIIATTEFSPDAQSFAKRNPRLELIDGKQLILLMNEHLGYDWPLHIERQLTRAARRLSDSG